MSILNQHRKLASITTLIALLTLVVLIGHNWLRPETPDPTLTTTETASTIFETFELDPQYMLPNRHKTLNDYGEAVITPPLSPAPAEPTATLQNTTPSATPSATPLPTATPIPVEIDADGVYQENRSIEDFTVDKSAIYIKAFNANVRILPRTDAAIVVKAAMGDKLTRTGYGNYWSQVTTARGETGYVLTDLISTTIIYKPAPTSTPKPSATPKPAPTSTPKPSATSSPVSITEPTAAPTKEPDTNVTSTPDAAPTVPAEHSDEFHLFARIISLEGHAPSGYESYLSVATVIMNQVAHKYYPGTVTGVVSYPGRFSTYTKAASGLPTTYSSAVYKAASDAYYNGKRNLPSYVIAFITPDAYERNVAAGGSFSKMEVYKIAYNAVWCYYARDES